MSAYWLPVSLSSELLQAVNANIAVAAATIVNDPKIVFADEPSGSLDLQNRAELHRLFFRLRDELGATFAIVTHDDNLASDADTVVRMADGRIISTINQSTK